MNIITKSVGLFGILTVLSGCSALTKNCPDDPFDPSASGLCRLFVTKEEQQAVISAESGKGTVLEREGTKLSADADKGQANLDSSRAELTRLKAELNAQNKRADLAESKLAALRELGTKTEAELNLMQSRIAEVRAKIAKAESDADSGDVDRLRALRDEMSKELDALLAIE